MRSYAYEYSRKWSTVAGWEFIRLYYTVLVHPTACVLYMATFPIQYLEVLMLIFLD